MRRLLIVMAATTCALLVLCACTNPVQLPAYVLIVPFIMLFIVVLTGLYVLLLWRQAYTPRNKRTAALAAMIPILLLILQSIGQLTLRDLLTIGAFFILGYFYISRTSVHA